MNKTSGPLLTRLTQIGVAFLASAVFGIALWFPLQMDERAHIAFAIKLATHGLMDDMVADMQADMLAQVRLAMRLSVEATPSRPDWESNAQSFLSLHPSYSSVEFVDPGFRVRWRVSKNPAELATDIEADNRLKQLLGDAFDRPGEAMLGRPFTLANGKSGLRAAVAIFNHQQFVGYQIATLEVERQFEAILADHTDGFSIAVADGTQPIYRSGGANAEIEKEFAQEGAVTLSGVNWRLRVWPEPRLLSKMDSRLPEVALAAGALLGLMLVTAASLFRSRQHKSRELALAYGELERRVQQRTAEVHELSRRLLQSQDEERRRIARELHDSTTQALCGVSINLEKAMGLGAQSRSDLLSVIAETAQMVDEVTNSIRTLSYLLHPPMLDDLGLEDALRWYVSGFSRRSGIQVDFNFAPTLGRLPRQLELTLYRIVQEALTNVHRHSGSSSAAISFLREDGRVALEIVDYGRGLRNIETGELGVGIAGMRERVGQLEGEFAIHTSVEGTSIKVVLPAPATSAGATAAASS